MEANIYLTRARMCLLPLVAGCSQTRAPLPIFTVPPARSPPLRCVLQRALFTVAPAKLKWYTVEWPAEQLSWADFRGNVLGVTNPAEATEGSVRRALFAGWEALGLAREPHTSENGVHASASPLEALFERMNW